MVVRCNIFLPFLKASEISNVCATGNSILAFFVEGSSVDWSSQDAFAVLVWFFSPRGSTRLSEFCNLVMQFSFSIISWVTNYSLILA